MHIDILNQTSKGADGGESFDLVVKTTVEFHRASVHAASAELCSNFLNGTGFCPDFHPDWQTCLLAQFAECVIGDKTAFGHNQDSVCSGLELGQGMG